MIPSTAMPGCAMRARAPTPVSLRHPKSRPRSTAGNRNRSRATTTTSAGSEARRASDPEGQDARQSDTPAAIATAAALAAKKVFSWGRAGATPSFQLVFFS
jgi:hypothetical protein